MSVMSRRRILREHEEKLGNHELEASLLRRENHRKFIKRLQVAARSLTRKYGLSCSDQGLSFSLHSSHDA